MKISGDLLDFPVIINIKPDMKTADTVSQGFFAVPNLRTKLNLLVTLLNDEATFYKVIVFLQNEKPSPPIPESIYNDCMEKKMCWSFMEINATDANQFHAAV